MTFARRRGSKAQVAAGQVGGRPLLLAKPQTFMNRSGQAVGRLCREARIPPEQLLVICDDLDLPLGRLRLRPAGGSGGHKGLRSIIEALGTEAFPRLRIGIDRPPSGMDPADYVLTPFAEAEDSLVAQVVERAVAAVICWHTEGLPTAMDRFNRAGPVIYDDDRLGDPQQPGPRAPAKETVS
jgi:PTH1 family peptidyl-tRNA hydrolase